MSLAHAGSNIKDLIIPVDYQDTLFHFYWNKVSGRGHEPIQDVTTIVPDSKFGQVIAIEDATTNLWTAFVNGTQPNIYNNFSSGGQIVASIYKLSETFMGQPVWRLEMTPTTQDALNSLRNNLWYHGIHSNSITYSANTSYCASVYWRPVTHMDTEVGGTASNIGAWTDGSPLKGFSVSVGNGWRRSWAYRTQGETPQSDRSFWSFRSPSVQLNEKIIVDWCMGQIESGRTFPTSFVAGTRGVGVLEYPKEMFPQKDFTVNMWISHTGDTRLENPAYKLFSLGSDFTTSRLTIWNYCPITPEAPNRRIISDYGNNDYGGRQFRDLVDPVLFVPGQWEMFTITFEYSTKKFTYYRNGNYWDTYTPAKLNPIHSVLLYNSGWKYSNLLISPRVFSPDEIRLLYHYGKPLYDPYNYYTVFGA